MTDKRAYLLVNVATLLWASNITLGRALRNDIGPLTLAAGRFLVAGVLFAVLMWDRPAEERRPQGDWLLLLAMSLTGVVAFSPTLYLGLHYTSAVNGALVVAMVPLVTSVLAVVLIDERLSPARATGVTISILGVGVVISGGSLAVLRQMRFNSGDLIVVGAVVLWSLYSILGRVVMRHRSVLSATALPIWIGLPVLGVAAFLEWQVNPPALSLGLLAAVVYISIFAVVVAFSAWNTSVRRLGPSRAMAFYNTLPLFGALLAVLFLGEHVGVSHLVGGALIIGGGLLGTR